MVAGAMNKSLTGIVVITILALLFFGSASWFLADKTPKLHLQRALRGVVPARVHRVEMRRDEATGGGTLRIHVVPEVPTLTAAHVEAIAIRTAAVMQSGEVVPTVYDAVDVAYGERVIGSWEREALERAAALLGSLEDLRGTLERAWGAAPPPLRATVSGGLPGIAFDGRPAGPRVPATDAEIARTVLRVSLAAGFVELPAATPGAPPVRIPRR